MIVEAAYRNFGKCEVILFGSRVDDTKRGGDFDISIKTDIDIVEFKKARIQFFKTLLLHDLDIPIDLIHYKSASKLLQKEINSKGVQLSMHTPHLH